MLLLRVAGEAASAICFLLAISMLPLANVVSIMQVLPLVVTLGAALFYKEAVGWRRWLAIMAGFVGVIVLVGGSSAIDARQGGLAVAAALSATVFYGVASSYTKRFLTGVPPLAVAAGSQLAAAIVLAPLAIWLWPGQTPTGGVWLHVIGLGIACTGIAYILFFRLVAHVGPTRAVSVTFLIPVFGVLWGLLFLGEQLTLNMVIGCAVILLGTSLSTGVLTAGKKSNAKPDSTMDDEDAMLRSGR